ncbi:hypothetical protein [Actinoplanes sp. N902-109]|uniref:hypothetical protein n=1 Tax=Actinoplanes sp. (strain N902-109) TaxID=649831 RepID=UPI000329489A|nr:hypothetical protein [Actinoplanes sp. N902-109]AGL13995.1 hypothetical protein L083_0485 [Actinoplanes sp. N902-109]
MAQSAPVPDDLAASAPVRLTDLARQVVRVVAPDELAMVDEVAAAWLAGDLDEPGAGGGPAGTVGLGWDAAPLVYVIFPIVTGVVGQVVAGQVERAGRRWRIGRRRRHDVVLDVALREHADQLRREALKQALLAGLPAERALELADAMHAAALRIGGPGELDGDLM